MNKIVVTEKFFEEFVPSVEPRRNLLLSTVDYTTKHNRNQLLKAIEKDDMEVMAMTAEPEGLLHTRFVTTIIEDCAQRIQGLEDKFGKSLNQALHEFLPKKFPAKNSKLSNFDFAKSLAKFPSIRPNLTFLIKNSYSEAMVKKSKLNYVMTKHKENQNTQKGLVRKLSHALNRKVSDRRLEIEQKLPQFRQINEEFLKSFAGNAPVQNIENINAMVFQRGKSMNLLWKYNDLWSQSKDLSLRKAINLKVTPYQNKRVSNGKLEMSH
jgi:hypothetical protein